MDALARLLGEVRKPAGEGLWIHRANAAAYLRAYSARQAAGDDESLGTMVFLAELVAGGLRDDDGALLLQNGEEALERLPVSFLNEHAEAVLELNAASAEDDLEGKSEPTP